jgi:hypothetical protein
MKFYTLPLFLLYIVIERNSILKKAGFLSLLVISPIVIHNILSAESHPNPLFVAFGLPAPGLWVNFFAWRFGLPVELGMISLYSLGLFVVLFGLYVFYFSPFKRKFLVMHWIMKELKMHSGRTLLDRLNSVLSTLYTNPEKT